MCWCTNQTNIFNMRGRIKSSYQRPMSTISTAKIMSFCQVAIAAKESRISFFNLFNLFFSFLFFPPHRKWWHQSSGKWALSMVRYVKRTNVATDWSWFTETAVRHTSDCLVGNPSRYNHPIIANDIHDIFLLLVVAATTSKECQPAINDRDWYAGLVSYK